MGSGPGLVYGEPVTSAGATETRPQGRRERKKQLTRDTIAREGLRLFGEQGFKETTIAQIAEAADVAESTFFLHFPTKEDVVFGFHAEEAEKLVALLDARGPGTTTLGVLRAYLHDLSSPDHWDPELWRQRNQVIQAEAALATQVGVRWAGVVRPALEASYARDYDDPAPVRARLLSSMTVASMSELGLIESDLDEAVAGGAAWKRAATERLVAALEAR
jgi:AcrR family transcriptional regulator